VIKALAGAIAGALLVMLMTAVPIAGVTKTPLFASPFWQQTSLYAIVTFAGALVVGIICSSESTKRERLLSDNLFAVVTKSRAEEQAEFQQTEKLWSRAVRSIRPFIWVFGLFYVFLYSAAIALCLRLRVCQFGDSIAETLRTVGIVLVAFAILLQTKAVMLSFSSPYGENDLPKTLFGLRHPVLLGWLIELLGLPLVFAVWLPLAALPGGFISFMWWIRLEENILRDRLGAPYGELQSGTWSLLPGLGSISKAPPAV